MNIGSLRRIALVVLVVSGSPGSLLAERPQTAAAATTTVRPSNEQSDLQQRQSIRAALLGEPSLSAEAKRCEIVVRGGFATLRGSVESENESYTIQILAALVVGRHHVANALEVKSRR